MHTYLEIILMKNRRTKVSFYDRNYKAKRAFWYFKKMSKLIKKICETSEFNLFAGLPVLRLFNILYLKIN